MGQHFVAFINNNIYKLEKVAISAALPLETTRPASRSWL